MVLADLRESLASLPSMPDQVRTIIPDGIMIADDHLATAITALQANPEDVGAQQQIIDLSIQRLKKEQEIDSTITDQDIKDTQQYLVQLFTHENAITSLSKQVIFYATRLSNYEAMTQKIEQERTAYTGNSNNPLSSKWTSVFSWVDELLHDSKSFNPAQEKGYSAVRLATLSCLEQGDSLKDIQEKKSSLSCAVQPKRSFELDDSNARLSFTPQELSSALNEDFDKDPVLLTLQEAQKAADQGKLYTDEQRAAFLFDLTVRQHDPSIQDKTTFLVPDSTDYSLSVADALLTTDIYFRQYPRDPCDIRYGGSVASWADWKSSLPQRTGLEKTTRRMCSMQELLIANLKDYDPYYKGGWYQCAVNVLDLKWFALGFGIGKVAQLSKIAGGVIVAGAVVLTGHQMMGIKGVKDDESVATICTIAGSFGIGMAGAAIGKAGARVVAQEGGSLLSRVSFKSIGSFFSYLGEEVRLQPSPRFRQTFLNRLTGEEKGIAVRTEETGLVRTAEETRIKPSNVRPSAAPGTEGPAPTTSQARAERVKKLLRRIFKSAEKSSRPLLDLKKLLGKPLLKTNGKVVIEEVFRVPQKGIFIRTATGIYEITRAVITSPFKGPIRKGILVRMKGLERDIPGSPDPSTYSDDLVSFLNNELDALIANRKSLPPKTLNDLGELAGTRAGSAHAPPPRQSRAQWEQGRIQREPSFRSVQTLRQKSPALANKLDQIMDSFYVRIYELVQLTRSGDTEQSRNALAVLKAFTEGRKGTFNTDQVRNDPVLKTIWNELRLIDASHLCAQKAPCTQLIDDLVKAWRGDEIPRLQAFVNTFLQGAEPGSGVPPTQAARDALQRIADRVSTAKEEPIPVRNVREILDELHRPCTPAVAA